MSRRRVSVTGLGYVGLPVAAAFARAGMLAAAFDVDERRVAELRRGHDRTGQVAGSDIEALAAVATADPGLLAAADFHIVTVPTPIDDAKAPDLGPLRAASRTVGRHLKPGGIVVYESTVYPGCVEEDCVPVLEAASGLACGTDFTVGYSPERINPGDAEHTFETIRKVVSGQDGATLDIVAGVYAGVVRAGVHRAPSIRAAEAAKVIENTQRDLNIALMNELSLIFDRMGLDTRDVLEAAATKWNFLPFRPGLVGGHCIGVDPYYLTHKAHRLGYDPQVILAGRAINDRMGEHVARRVIRALLRRGAGGRARVAVLGITFKENVPDIRNSRVVDVVRVLEDHDIAVQVADPLADAGEVEAAYGLRLAEADGLEPADAVVLAVGHAAYREGGWPLVAGHLRRGRGFVADIQGVLDRTATPDGVELWRL